MRMTFWGTRGSIPTPGSGTVRYGGNTPCVEVRLNDNSLIIFDAGTGIRQLGDLLQATGDPVDAIIAISHPHWDHIQGLPFFKPAFVPGNTFRIVGSPSRTVTLRRIIADQMDRVHFPIQLRELKARITFSSMRESAIPLYGGVLSSCYVNHPSFALGYRFDIAGRSLVYISDNEPFDRRIASTVGRVDSTIVKKFNRVTGDPNQRIFDFARGADVLIHDATYTPEEYTHHAGWGHSDYLFALEVAAKAAARRLVLFHHSQTHSDNQIDDIVTACHRVISERSYDVDCIAAAEGMELEW